MRRGGFFKQLNLTEDQQAKIKQIRQSFAETNKPLRDQLLRRRVHERRPALQVAHFPQASHLADHVLEVPAR